MGIFTFFCEENKTMKNSIEQQDTSYYDKKIFCDRITEVMHRTNMDWDTLANKFCEKGYTITSANLKTYVLQRNLSLKVLVFLSRTLGVSMDYLVGNEQTNTQVFHDGFDYEYDRQRYRQYSGNFFVYFYPTRTNEPEEIIVAQLQIEAEKHYYATLEIPIEDGKSKKYTGHLLLSQKTYTAFLSMMGSNGEMIQFIFNDPNTFQNKIRFCVAGLISVSSGDLKRMPTLSRAIITEKKITDIGVPLISANLRLNTKYITIQEENLKSVLECFFNSEKIGNTKEIVERLTTAFKPKTIFAIEEQYFLNTFRNENNLSDLQVEQLIADLRNVSTSSINCKIPRKIDSRLYLLLKEKNLFDEETNPEK